MKFVGLLLALTAAAWAQPAPPQALQHGVRISGGLGQSAKLFGTDDDPDSAIGCTVAGALGAGLIRVQGQLVLVERNTDLASLGIDRSAPCAHFDTWIEQLPTDYAESVIAGNLDVQRGTSKTTIQRFIRDNLRLVYIRYAVTVEKMPEAGAYRVTFTQASAPVPADLRPKGDWKIVSPAHLPVPQIVRDGDEIRLLLYTNPNGVELVEYLSVGRADKMAPRKDAARDVYALDSEFTLTKPRVSIDGLVREPGLLPETIRGGIVWVYVPGFGRYVLAFAPHPGMERVGEVAGGSASLLLDGNLLRIAGADRVASGDGVYNVYALRDESWQPADPKDRERFMIGASPGIETALANR